MIEKDIDALILCGGQGTRFRAVREDIPKALAPIRGTTFIDLLLDDLVFQGFERIILATGFLSSQIEDHVKLRNDAEYIISLEPKPLGTGGAIKFAAHHFRSNPVLVMNGDSKIDCNYYDLLSFHQKEEAGMTVLLSEINHAKDYGNVELDYKNRIVAFFEKPKELKFPLVNAGVYLMNTELLGSRKNLQNFSLEKDCLPIWTQSSKIMGYVTESSFQDIGTPERYKRFNE